MLGKRSGPGKLPGSSLVSGTRSPLLEFKIQSPRGLKNYDLGGVGLGIVAALEKSGECGGEILAKYAVCGPSSIRSDPITVNSARINRGGFEGLDMGSLENYTYVTSHGPNKSFTRVYCDRGEYGRSGHDRRCKNLGVFNESPASFPTSDFLSSCHLCMKKLHGKDIYMYRGEKAFCSTECRYRQIVIDERKEQCRSEASRSADVSSSPYTRGQIFSTGIVAI